MLERHDCFLIALSQPINWPFLNLSFTIKVTLLQAFLILKESREVYVCVHAFMYVFSSLILYSCAIYDTWNAAVGGGGAQTIVCECLDEQDVP